VPSADVIAHPNTPSDAGDRPDADACIFYSTRDHGLPAGAQLTHRGCITNLFNMMYEVASSALATQRATARNRRLRRRR
jgi:long-chain acyl-CoA synthetase